MPSRMQRRRFLQSSAALAATSFFVNPTPAAQAPRERVRIGVIGVNGQGQYNWSEAVKTGLAEVVALCDVDATRSAPVVKNFPKARFVEDYRRLLDQPRDLDAVIIATPDHHHAIPTLMAISAGKHVYCEKPLTHSVHEVRTIMDAAARNKVITQMGTQIHAGENYRKVVEIVQSGMLGTVRRVHVWCARRPDAAFRVKETAPPPKGLNYDLWIGPAPRRNYPAFRTGASDTSVHFHWRWWWDFGGGVLADMACHFMDLPHWALNLRQPTSVAANGRVTYKGDNDMPDLMQVEYEYPARGSQPPVHLTWYHGQPGPDLTGKVTHAGFSSGVQFEGEKGSVVADYGSFRLLPVDRFKGVELPKPTLPRSVGHHREWLQAIIGGGTTTCNFAYSGALTETVLLGNVAYKAGGKIQYDAKTGRVTGAANAEQHLRREYRAGWTL